MTHLEQLQAWIDGSDNIVFFGGAGVSTESGIPDFRSVDGLYHQQFPYPPEVMLSHTFYEHHPEEFFDFYRKKLLVSGAKPNAAHRKLSELERALPDPEAGGEALYPLWLAACPEPLADVLAPLTHTEHKAG